MRHEEFFFAFFTFLYIGDEWQSNGDLKITRIAYLNGNFLLRSQNTPTPLEFILVI